MPGRDLAKPGYNTLWRMGLLTGGRCTGTNKQGHQCKAKAIVGGEVCLDHGGTDPIVRAAAQENLTAYVEHLCDPDRLLFRTAMIAYADPGEAYGKDGKLLPIDQWPPGLTMALASIRTKVVNLTAGDGIQDEVVEVKFQEPIKALELLMTHKGLLTKRVEITGEIDIVEVLQEGRARVARDRAESRGKTIDVTPVAPAGDSE